jgi:hypothetical protein
MASAVSTPLPEYTDHQARLELINALMGGTDGMREASMKYLPQEPAESNVAYKVRLARTFLFNAFKRTLQKLAGEVFSKDIALQDDVPEQIKTWCEDVDLQGRNESRFAQEVFMAVMKDGVTHILVDYPRADGLQTLADEKAVGMRPYMVHVKASQVIGWQTEIRNGKQVVTQVRISETIKVPEGDYGQREVERIRVFTPDLCQVWEEQERDGKEEWVMVDEAPLTLGFIPLVTIVFGEALSPMTAAPPLEDLAQLNLAHWQSSSDQRNILHVVRCPFLFGKGITDAQGQSPGEEGSKLEIGANRLVHSTNPEADMKYIEHSGAGIDAGRQDLQDLKDEMSLFGLSLMLPKTGNETATAKAIDAGENDSALRGWAMILKDCLELALSYMAQWSKLGDSGGSVVVNTDFRALNVLELSDIGKMVIAGKLPLEVYVVEAQRRGALMDSWDMVEIQALLEADRRSSSTLAGLAGSFLTPKAPAAAPPAPPAPPSPGT